MRSSQKVPQLKKRDRDSYKEEMCNNCLIYGAHDSGRSIRREINQKDARLATLLRGRRESKAENERIGSACCRQASIQSDCVALLVVPALEFVPGRIFHLLKAFLQRKHARALLYSSTIHSAW